MLAPAIGRRTGAGDRRRGRAHSVQEWGPTLAICCVMVTVCLAGVLAIHLSLSPGGLSWRPVPHRTSRRHATQDGGGSDKASALIAGGPTDAPTGSSQGADTPGPAVRDGSEAGAAPAEPPRTSAQAEPLSDAQLHGGWQLTQEASSARGGRVFDRATKHPNATVVSWAAPRVVLIRDFLSPAEVAHLERQARGGFERSEVVSDEATLDASRTSFGAWLSGHKRDAKVREIQHRIHALVGIPEQFGESLYVLQYELGQRYDAHTDHCAQTAGQPVTSSCEEFLERAGGPKCGPGGGGITCGDRLATVVLYLRSPSRGGSTVFPHAPKLVQPGGPAPLQAQPREGSADGAQHAGEGAPSRSTLQQQHGSGVLTGGAEVPSYCEEGADALQVSPPPGTAVLFWDYVPAGAAWQPGDLATPDPQSLHGGCPVLEGTKLIATRWIRASNFE